ncbi:uncharacterized protein V1478_015652 [Vespula squamosa]|uniref:Odorant receptor n=1 Tax=Vespula squamosa TaxID=30214 RepID=A0ABD2A1G5_VESSQ
MATRSVSFFERHFLFSNQLVLFILGLRSGQSLNQQFFIFSAIIIYLLPGIIHQCYVLLAFSFYQFYQLSTMDITMQSTVRVFQKIIASIGLLSSYSTTYFSFLKVHKFSYPKRIHCFQMKLLFTHFKLYCEQLSDEDEIDIMKKYTNETKSYVYFILVSFKIYIILIISPSILQVFLNLLGLNDNQLILPIPVNNVTNSGLLYYFLLIYQIFGIILVSTIGSVSLSAYLVAVQHACCQLSVIMYVFNHKKNISLLKIWQPFKKNSKYTRKVWSLKTSTMKWEWVVNIIQRYREATEYVNLLNEFSKITYLITIFLAMILIIADFVYMFQIFKVSHNIIEIIECSIYIVVSMLLLYINFYLGQKLLNHSNAIFDELNKIPFYNFSINYQKLLLFLILRSGKPCVLSIGSMFVSSHVTFSGLMRKAFSFATVCYTVQ